MKRIMVMAVAVFALALAACSQKSQNGQAAEAAADSVSNSKVLVAYFSASGVTEGVAKMLAEVTDGDIHQIQPEQPYTEADLDWRNKQSRSSVEMADKASRPAIASKLGDISQYETIYLGFPIWWGTAPTIINTFMEAADFTGKTIIPFATSGSSGIEQAVSDLKAAYPQANWEDGMLLNNKTKEDLQELVK